MAAAVALRGVNEATMAHATAAPPIVAGYIGRDEQRLTPTAAVRAQEPPAPERSGIVRDEREPRVGRRVPARKHGLLAPVEVRENVSEVEGSARLDDVRVAPRPLVESGFRQRHLALA